MWFPGGQHRVSKVDTMWFLQDTTGFPHGCHVVSIWTPCVVEVTTLKPAQKTALHEANWLPCYLLCVYLLFGGKETLLHFYHFVFVAKQVDPLLTYMLVQVLNIWKITIMTQ